LILALLITAFALTGPSVFGIGERLERRHDKRIAVKGNHRDAVRLSRVHFAKTSGLRRASPMPLLPSPRAGPIWALPVLTARRRTAR